MPSIITRKKGNARYYHLRHNTQDRQKEIYLGKRIPKDIEEIKERFVLEFYREEWSPQIQEITRNYARHVKRLPSDALEKELMSFSVKFTYNTQRIEGSSMTLKDTAFLLEDGMTPSNRPYRDVREAELHQRMFLEILRFRGDLSGATVLRWHKKLFDQTKPAIAGKVRDYNVGIMQSESRPPRHEAVNQLLTAFFKWYNKQKRILNPVELACLVHLKFVTIHPFGDGNGRISRLLMNFVLHRNGCPMMDIGYVDRKSYYNALERSHIKECDIVFLRWFMRRYLKEHEGLITGADV